MNATDTDEITAYVEAVRAALAGLPEDVREGLLEDLPEHLAEVVADDIGTLADRLGPPSVYAAELLASAGFVGGGFPDPPPPPRRRDLPRRWGSALGRRARQLDVATGPLFGKARATEFLVQLRPAWWVLRGYLVAMVLAAMLGSEGSLGLLPRAGGSELVAFLLLGVCVVASVWFGRRRFRLNKMFRLGHGVATAILLIIALNGFSDADQNTRFQDEFSPASYIDRNADVQDVFVYDKQGKLIEGARLLDQNGQPIRLGNGVCYDEATQSYLSREDNGTYPYCVENAPFRMGETSPSVAPEPTPR